MQRMQVDPCPWIFLFNLQIILADLLPFMIRLSRSIPCRNSENEVPLMRPDANFQHERRRDAQQFEVKSTLLGPSRVCFRTFGFDSVQGLDSPFARVSKVWSALIQFLKKQAGCLFQYRPFGFIWS